MHDLDFVLRMADPIHGLIGVTDIERKIIDSQAFQRLRHIKQLGNVHLLFPGAVHTRFAHSIGVMHTTSLLYSALLRDFINKNANENYLAAARNVHQAIRLAGLLHDIGHGPLSHHFEECLRKYDEKESKFVKVLFSEWSGDLKIPDRWIIESARKSFIGHELEHEHFSFGLIQKLGVDLSFDGQGVCSLLSNDIGTSDELNKQLAILAEPFSNRAIYNEKLRLILKSLLSGDIDADRLDYLRRDSYYCGTSIAAIDINHLLASAKIAYKDGDFFIEISKNAIPVIENVLISRKQMFNQIYNHRINGSFDYLMSRVVDSMIVSSKHKTLVPSNYANFINMTDDFLEKSVAGIISDNKAPDKDVKMKPANRMEFEELANVCAKFYATRTPLVRISEEDVLESEAEKRIQDLERDYGPNILVTPIDLKSFYKRSKTGADLIRVKPRSGDTDTAHTMLSATSDVLTSKLWQDNMVRIVVYEGFKASAEKRALHKKLEQIVLLTPATHAETEAK